jgi:tripartite-type tricarboxylate transporter receptor subunit TctC
MFRIASLLIAALAAMTAASVTAQSWPTKPVTLVVPFPPGGGTDAFARPISAQFAKNTGKQLVIDNRGGAGGTVGASIAAKAAPDGYTLFMGAVHHTIAPSMYPRLDYDLEKDFIPLALVAVVPQVVVVNPKNVPATNMKEFTEFLRKNPAKLNYGSAGTGTSHHLAGELFKLQSKTFITHIPYTGAGPSLRDLVGGQVDMMFDGLGSSSAHIKGGRVKALMVSGDKRNAAFPDVPSAKESGMPDYTVTTWYGIWAPKGTPVAVQTAAVAEIKKAIESPELKAIWATQGAESSPFTQAQFGTFINSEIKRWQVVVKASGAKLD